MKKLALYFHTIKYLKFIQIFYRLYYKFIPTYLLIPKNLPEAKVREVVTDLVSPNKKHTYLDGNSIVVFGRDISIPSGQWVDSKASKLENYNINYFDFLFGKAVITSKEVEALILNWIKANNDFNTIPWHAYPCSLRLVNWIQYIQLHKINNDIINASILKQARWLINNLEYQLLGNHLFVNAKALIFAGLYLDGKESNLILSKGITLFNAELSEQLLADGGSFELSPMYHAIMLEDLLDIHAIFSIYNLNDNEAKCHSSVVIAISQMFLWLSIMCLPNGRYSHFNDSSGGVASTLDELLKYSQDLLLPANDVSHKGNVLLKETGYACLQNSNAYLLCDVANVGPDYIPGHAHADTLSFEFSLFGADLIVNSGTSEYGLSVERSRQRSTLAHSTLSIDNENSSQTWGGFRVAKRAKITALNFDADNSVIQASHNGYKRLGFGAIHSRKWELGKEQLSITDSVSGNGLHLISTYFHLAPDIKAEVQSSNTILLTLAGGKTVLFKFDSCFNATVSPSTYHPQFGRRVNNLVINLSGNITLPFSVEQTFTWNLNENS
jgi:uncharacterized heparinase superfamily protein